jgi:hypothetical protein
VAAEPRHLPNLFGLLLSSTVPAGLSLEMEFSRRL